MNHLQEALRERGDGEIAHNWDPKAQDPNRAALALALPTTIAKDLRHVRTKLPAEGTGIEQKERAIEVVGDSEEAPPRE